MRLPRRGAGDNLEVQKGSTMKLNYFQDALDAAAKSLDPSTKVGAVVVTEDGVCGIGNNHFPDGAPESFWNVRDLKYKAVVHAEIDALLSAGLEAVGATMYVTHHPCRDCAKVIASAGIKTVVCPDGPWRDDPAIIESVMDARELFKICGVEMVRPE